MKKTKLYLTAPTIGHYAESIRHEIFDHVFDELESCGYEMTGHIYSADKIIVIEMPGWDNCDRVSSDVKISINNEIPGALIKLWEFL